MTARIALAVVAIAGLSLAGCSSPRNTGASGGRPLAPQGIAGGGVAAPAYPSTPLPDGSAPGYDRAGFGTEVDPATTPQSTFAMDVDTASYGYARNLIKQGQRPAPG